MAGYDTSNPPHKVWSTLAGASGWYYTDADDDAATVAGAGYFTDGHDLGMRLGDVVYIVETENAAPFLLVLASVTVSTSGGASTVVTI